MPSRKPISASSRQLIDLVTRACQVAKDSAFNIKEFLGKSSGMALVTVKQCEKELDELEREIDESLPGAITQVKENEARELLGCLKFIIDLERIGDLFRSAAKGLHQMSRRLSAEDLSCLLEITETLEGMLEHIHRAFSTRDLALAEFVLGADSKIDRACHALFRRHLESRAGKRTTDEIRILFIAQAFERAGDHAKNLAEEVIYLIRGHSLRHASKTRRSAD